MDIPDFDDEHKKADDFINSFMADYYANNGGEHAKVVSWAAYWGRYLQSYKESPENNIGDTSELLLDYSIRQEFLLMEILKELRIMNKGDKNEST